MNSVTGFTKRQKQKNVTIHTNLSFLFLNAHFKFETEILVDCTNISGEPPQFFLEFFDTFKNVFFLLMFLKCIVSPKALYH